MTSIYLNDLLAEMYSAVIRRIYILVYGIKLSTKLPKAFCYKQNKIYGDDIGEVKCLLFSKVEILLLGNLKKQLHIYAKLVKGRSVTAISIIMCLCLTR